MMLGRGGTTTTTTKAWLIIPDGGEDEWQVNVERGGREREGNKNIETFVIFIQSQLWERQ